MSALASAFDRLIDALAWLAGAIFAAMTLAIIVNVALRAYDGSSLYGMVDLIEWGLMAATFLAAPWVLRLNAHVAVDIVVMGMSPLWRRRLGILVSLAGAVLSLCLAWSSALAAMISYSRGSMIRGILVIPEWWPLMAPTLAGVLLAVEFLRRMVWAPPAERQTTGL